MTSTAVGLPDRYRPLDQAGPDEVTPTGVIRSWRAKDRVLNRDVAIRVHTPGGPAARGWISRALTAGGLATPALAMVYDAAEGSADGAAAYVVNEWIEGESLAERLTRGPMPAREARTLLRRLAEGVAEAHRVGLPVGGLTPEHVVLRPNGLVGLRSVPAAAGTVDGDIAALGALLEACLTGARPEGSEVRPMPADLAALVHRARSTEPGQGLSSVAAMAALLADRSSPAGPRPAEIPRADAAEPARRSRGRRSRGAPPPVGAAPATTVSVSRDQVPPLPHPVAHDVPPLDALPYDDPDFYDDDLVDDFDDEDPDGLAAGGARRRVLVYGLPLLALAIVIGVAVWFGTSVLSVASSVDQQPPPALVPLTPSSSAPAHTSSPPAPGTAAPIASASVFDPFGDGQSENDNDVPLSYDGNPVTAWSTLTYRGSAAFGNLKPGVGVLYDLGSPRPLGGVSIRTAQPGAVVEIRTGSTPDGALASYPVAGTATLDRSTEVHFARPVTSRYVLVWLTRLVPSDGGFSADLAEVNVQAAG